MWTEDERRQLEELRRQLTDAGWAEHVTVEALLRDWQELARDVGRYPESMDDFTNDLTSRDGLEEALLRCPSETLGEKLRRLISPADERYRDATDDDGGAALSRYFRVDAKSGWWWRRCPKSGPLAKYLGAASPH